MQSRHIVCDLSTQSDSRSSISFSIPSSFKSRSVSGLVSYLHIFPERAGRNRSKNWNYTSACKEIDTFSDSFITFPKANYEVRRDSISAENIHCSVESIKNCVKRKIRAETTEKLRVHSFNIVFYLACACRINAE